MKKIDKLLFGTPGIPQTTKPYNTIEGIGQVRKLGLEAMELEFVHSINISQEKAPLVKEASKKHDVVLTCHGEYFINLNSAEQKKIDASKNRVYNAAKRAFECGGWSMCFHSAFYLGQNPQSVFEKVKTELKEIVKKLQNEGIEIWVRPETMGKQTQFGSLDEILEMCTHIENVLPCIDFSHLHARANGKFNSFEEFCSVLALVEKKLGKEGLSNMHIHAQGVEYNEKGERRHLPFDQADLKYIELVKAFKEFKLKGVVICESPLVEEDTLKLAQAYHTIK